MAAAKKSPQEAFEATFKTGQETVENALNSTTKAFQKNFEQTFEASRKRVDEVVKGYGDVAAFNKDNMEAVIASGTAAAKGVEELSNSFFSLTKKLYENNVEALKALSSAKNPKDYFEIQSDLFKNRYQELVEDTARLGEAGKSCATDAIAPINSRVTVAVESFSKQFTL